MKKIIYVFALALLAVSLGCQKEDLYESSIDESTKNSNINTNPEKLNITELDVKPSSPSFEVSTNSTDTNFYDEHGNPVETYYLYLDMDYIESNYNGTYTGSFSQHYYNEMSTHFTIHSVEYADASCGNIERWVVTKPEYENYLISIGGSLVGVIAVYNNGDNNSSTSSGSSSSTGWGDENGNVSSTPPTKKPKDPTQVDSTIAPVEYQGCF